jgi:uncharacterized membrane protein
LSDRPQLVMAFFDSGDEAETAARRLMAWTRSNPLARLEAVGVLVKDDYGAISTRKLGPRETRKGMGIGLAAGVIGVVATGGLTLLQGLVVGAAGGGAVGSFFHKGLHLDADARARVGRRLDPGHGAVGVLVPPRQAAAIADRLEEYGGTRYVPDAPTPATEKAPAPEKASEPEKAPEAQPAT